MYGLFNLINLNNMLNGLDEREPLDIKTKEGYEKAMELVNELRENVLVRQLVGESFVDKFEETITKIYEEANTQTPVQPSTLCNAEQKRQVNLLVDEYVDTVIQPVGKFNADVLQSVKNSLFEFGCWILNK